MKTNRIMDEIRSTMSPEMKMQLGDMQMTKTPVIILPDLKVIIASLFLAIAGIFLLKKKR